RYLKDKQKIEEDSELFQKADQMIYFVLVAIAYGIVQKISHSVGSERLKETYKDVLFEVKDKAPKAISLIDVSIKLDHFKGIPEDEILVLYSGLKTNIFTSTILRQLVLNHLYLYPSSYRTRQSICSKLDIAIESARLIENKLKTI